MGRAKIPITWIKSDASRHVTFTKRLKEESGGAGDLMRRGGLHDLL